DFASGTRYGIKTDDRSGDGRGGRPGQGPLALWQWRRDERPGYSRPVLLRGTRSSLSLGVILRTRESGPERDADDIRRCRTPVPSGNDHWQTSDRASRYRPRRFDGRSSNQEQATIVAFAKKQLYRPSTSGKAMPPILPAVGRISPTLDGETS